ncbi:putative CoA-binding protein [Labrenzia sp. EL_159]|uniref:hypothetical protein n=1 Tax=Roseibium album TaxID=311410 RepID=UPI00131F2C2E|nr:hypothetical protein [Roseibium album]MBG6158957.1 putative CoA-binding protein [Labrenzia sp. EL_162]MBG6197491.1 putative CoA-binding protein [Labrenzia sp. EL_159]
MVETLDEIRKAWGKDPSGVLNNIQSGIFDEQRAIDFVELLRDLNAVTDIQYREAVKLLWNVPLLLKKKEHKIFGRDGGTEAYSNFCIEVEYWIEKIINKEQEECNC